MRGNCAATAYTLGMTRSFIRTRLLASAHTASTEKTVTRFELPSPAPRTAFMSCTPTTPRASGRYLSCRLFSRLPRSSPDAPRCRLAPWFSSAPPPLLPPTIPLHELNGAFDASSGRYFSAASPRVCRPRHPASRAAAKFLRVGSSQQSDTVACLRFICSIVQPR